VLGSPTRSPSGSHRQAATEDDRLCYRQFQNVVEEPSRPASTPGPCHSRNDPNAFRDRSGSAHASIAATT
jgi:hypothetical protein